MKIGKSPGSASGVGTPASTGNGAAQRTGSANSAQASAGAGQASSSKVTLSAPLQAAIAAAGTGEVFDAKAVASIKEAITNGSFQVNPEKVADNLLQSVHEMIQARASGQGA